MSLTKGVRTTPTRRMRVESGVDRDPRMENERVSPPDSITMGQMREGEMTSKPFPKRERPGGGTDIISVPLGVNLRAPDLIGTADPTNIPTLGPSKITNRAGDANFNWDLIPGLVDGAGEEGKKVATQAQLANKAASGHNHPKSEITDFGHNHNYAAPGKQDKKKNKAHYH